MSNRQISSTIFSIGFLISIILGLFIQGRSHQNNLKVKFFDVGQGDAILISVGDRQMLIDGGRDGRLLLEKLGRSIPFWDRTIEILVATHPDQDHIGGLSSVLERYKVPTIIISPAQSSSKVAAKFLEAVKNEGSQVMTGYAGTSISISDKAKVEIVLPRENGEQESTDESTNAASVTMRLVFGEHSFIFTGDLTAEQERELIINKIDIQSDILKVAHHGSKHSTTSDFLDAVSSKEAIISVGARNSYGHPGAEVLSRLRERGIRIWRTDDQGDIEFTCTQEKSECTSMTSR